MERAVGVWSVCREHYNIVESIFEDRMLYVFFLKCLFSFIFVPPFPRICCGAAGGLGRIKKIMIFFIHSSFILHHHHHYHHHSKKKKK
jgi:hypothetical protein